MDIFPTRMFVHQWSAWCQWKPEEGDEFYGTGVTDPGERQVDAGN